jgi:Family of unknown function (DUF6228)
MGSSSGLSERDDALRRLLRAGRRRPAGTLRCWRRVPGGPPRRVSPRPPVRYEAPGHGGALPSRATAPHVKRKLLVPPGVRTASASGRTVELMSEWVLEASRPVGAVLRITPHGSGDWDAEIVSSGLQAKHRIWERFSRDRLELDAYFARLHEQWRGWSGAVAWESQGLILSSTHDGLGHVCVAAQLDSGYGSGLDEDWKVSLNLFVDAGALGDIARSARALDPS